MHIFVSYYEEISVNPGTFVKKQNVTIDEIKVGDISVHGLTKN